MKFPAHGHYRLRLCNNIFLLNAYDSWNKETAEALFDDMEGLLAKSDIESFAKIIDATEWALGTPEFERFAREGIADLYNHGLKKEAYIVGSGGWKREQLLRITADRNETQRRFFTNKRRALLWLKSEGFSLS